MNNTLKLFSIFGSLENLKANIMFLIPQKWIERIQISPKNLRLGAILISIYEIVSIEFFSPFFCNFIEFKKKSLIILFHS